MPKRRKHHGKPNRGPFSSKDFERALLADGWYTAQGGKHPCFRHPTRPGKAQVPSNWTAVKVGHDAFRGLLVQTGYAKDELLRLLGGQQP